MVNDSADYVKHIESEIIAVLKNNYNCTNVYADYDKRWFVTTTPKNRIEFVDFHTAVLLRKASL